MLGNSQTTISKNFKIANQTPYVFSVIVRLSNPYILECDFYSKVRYISITSSSSFRSSSLRLSLPSAYVTDCQSSKSSDIDKSKEKKSKEKKKSTNDSLRAKRQN